MKIRTDFVTNSSSSIFTIACNKELSRETLYEAFQIPADHPLRDFMDHVVSPTLIEAERKTEEWIRECMEGYDSYPDEYQCYKSIVDKGFKLFYQGSFFSSGHQWVTAEEYLSKFHLPTLITEDIVFISKKNRFHVACVEQLTKEKLFEALRIPSSHPLREYFKDIVDGIVNSIQYWRSEKMKDEHIKIIRRELEKMQAKHKLDAGKFNYYYSGIFSSKEHFFDYQYLFMASLSVKSKDFVMFKVFNV